MKLSLTAAHLFSISLSAVCLFSAAATARAQQAIDCTLPTPEPSGVVSENLAFCAIHHAQYLYFQRCPDLSNCPCLRAPLERLPMRQEASSLLAAHLPPSVRRAR